MFILFIVTMLVSSVKVKAESSEITNLLEQFYDLNNGELPFAMPEKIVFIGDRTFWWTPLTELTFHAESYPQYIGSEYFSMGDDEAEYRIILPFDADIEHYFGNPEYVMQKKNVTIIFCEDPSYASKIQMHLLNA